MSGGVIRVENLVSPDGDVVHRPGNVREGDVVDEIAELAILDEDVAAAAGVIEAITAGAVIVGWAGWVVDRTGEAGRR